MLSDDHSRNIIRRAEETIRQSIYFRRKHASVRLSIDKGTTLVVEGRVSSYFLKQVLQEELSRVRGNCKIENRVEVVVR